MGVRKKSPVEKIRRKALWPSFVGFVVVCVVFAFLYNAIVGFFIHNVIDRKNRESYETALSVKTFLDTHEEFKNGGLLPDTLSQLGVLNPDIYGICFINSHDEIIWQLDDNTPSFQKNLEYKLEGCTILFDQDIEEILSEIHENNRALSFFSSENDMILNHRIFSRLFESGTEFLVDPSQKIASIPCWVILDEEGNAPRLCVKTEISMRGSEIAPFLFVFGISIVFSLIMFFWFIISFFRLFADRRRLDYILNLDPITGGMNWTYYVKNGTRILKRNRRKNNHYAVISLAMRKYTNYCTYYGVTSGEEILAKFYTILQNCIGKKELAVRHERAEFALLLMFDDEAGLEQRLKKITFMLNSAAMDQSFHFSTGVYIIDRNEDNITEIYNSAAVARNCCSDDATKQICYFTDEMYNNQVWERKVENDMEKALYNHEFELYLQPKYDTQKETLSAAEALVRWNHPTEGSVPPGKFIPIFEANGFIIQLDDYMLTEVARVQAAWIARKQPVVPISVNVSRAHFTKNDLAQHICKIVDVFNVPHSVIELELTESAFFDDKEALLNTVKKLRSAGFKVSMDDFGAGYSSLNTLKELPLDVVKLDAEFFRGKDEMNRGKLIVEETINLAKKLNMQIVAEGIENREQVDFLKKNGCDLIQGFFFAKPMSVPDFEKSAFKQNQGNVRSIE